MNYTCAITNKLGRIVAPIAAYSDDCTVYPSRNCLATATNCDYVCNSRHWHQLHG